MKNNRCACGRIAEGRERPINDESVPLCDDCRMFLGLDRMGPARESGLVTSAEHEEIIAGLFARSFR